MKKITRRAALSAVPAAAATLLPMTAVAIANEHPWDKANRLAQDLAATLDDVGGARWYAGIYPKSDKENPSVYFGRIDALAEVAHDPLIDAINRYRAAVADFNENAPQDDDGSDLYAKRSYMPAMETIEDWDQPAKTMKGAVEALRLAVEEGGSYAASLMAESLLAAALGYFDGRV